MLALATARWARAMPAAVSGLAIGVLLSLLQSHDQAVAAVAMVALFGISHGASDHLMAGAAWRRRLGRCWLAAFAVAYVAAAACVFRSWQFAPQSMLALFLAASAWHFAQDAQAVGPSVGFGCAGGGWAAAAYGLLPVAGSSLLHGGELAGMLAPLLVSADVAGVFVQGLRMLAALAVMAATTAALQSRHGGRHGAAIELAAVLGVTVLLPPLIGFAIYFCFVHAPRQLRQRCAVMNCGWLAYHSRVMPCTLGGIVTLAMAYLLVPTATSALLIGLAALTFPHMLLVPDRPRS